MIAPARRHALSKEGAQSRRRNARTTYACGEALTIAMESAASLKWMVERPQRIEGGQNGQSQSV
jgi:hypothetical protein